MTAPDRPRRCDTCLCEFPRDEINVCEVSGEAMCDDCAIDWAWFEMEAAKPWRGAPIGTKDFKSEFYERLIDAADAARVAAKERP